MAAAEHICVVDQARPSAQAVGLGERALVAHGVVVVPTDSVYGLAAACVSGNPGHERIFEMKGRDRAQTLPLLVADYDSLDVLARDVRPWARELVRRFWPGALTIVVEASDALPRDFVAADGSVALRMPDSVLVRELARRCGGALAVTSANTHGAPSPASFDQPASKPRIIIIMTLSAELPASCERNALTYGVRKNSCTNDIHM